MSDADIDRLTEIAYTYEVAIAQALSLSSKVSDRGKTSDEYGAELIAIRKPVFREMVCAIVSAMTQETDR